MMKMKGSALSLFLVLWQLLAASASVVSSNGEVRSEQEVAAQNAAGEGEMKMPPPLEDHIDEMDGWTKPGKIRRRAQADSFFPADDPYWNPFGIMERKPCVPFDALRPDQKGSEFGDAECDVGTCGDDSCCRAYFWLKCDSDSSFAYVPCVCADNTWPSSAWTRAPTPTVPTPPPTPFPTMAATPAPVIVTAAPVASAVPAPAPGALNIVETAEAAGDFTTLLNLLSVTGLDVTLSGPGPFTVFAPNDAAFPTGAALLEFIANTDVATLTSILTYHVIPGAVPSSGLVDGAQVLTVEGNPVTITLPAAGGVLVNEANVIAPDIVASNGIIHVIDAVLIPPTPSIQPVPDPPAPGDTAAPVPAPGALNIVETAEAAGGFTTLLNLLSVTGLDDTLSGPGPFTVFAPNDAAFPTGDALSEFIANTDVATLASILTYHVIPGAIPSSSLVDGAQVTTVEGSPVTITLPAAGGVLVNEANVIAPDIVASNGIIHVIDAVLIPPAPSIQPVPGSAAPADTAAPGK